MDPNLERSRRNVASNQYPIDEDCIEAYENAAFSDRPPLIESFLPNADDVNYIGTLVELIAIDLELKWRERPPLEAPPSHKPEPATHSSDSPLPLIENYIERFSLLNSPDVLKRLARIEFDIRWAYGDCPSQEEYTRRFPSLAQEITDFAAESTHMSDTSSHARSSMKVGDVVGHYQLIAAHAQGGFGTVWRARDRRLDREVALKELRHERTDGSGIKGAFIHEARITARLDHPGIVPILDVTHLDAEHPYYVMKFVRGRTLDESIAAAFTSHEDSHKDDNRNGLERRRLLRTFLSICKTIAFCHSRQIIHRDLKPQNILVGEFGETTIIDWGLAKQIQDPESKADSNLIHVPNAAQTMAGEIKGTPAFMSPEQAKGDVERVNNRSDIYALGAILYLVITGKRPIEGESVDEVLKRVANGEVRAPLALKASVSPALSAICMKSMSPDPKDRYAEVEELISDLEKFLADESVSVYREGVWLQVGRWMRRHRRFVTPLAVGAAVAFVSLVVGTVLLGTAYRNEHRALEMSDSNLKKANENFRKVQEQKEEIETEHRRAQDNLDLAIDAVDTFMVRVSTDSRLREAGMEQLLTDLLLQGESFFDELAQQQGANIEAFEQKTDAYLSLASINLELGEYDKCAEYLSQANSMLESAQIKESDETHRAMRTGMMHRINGQYHFELQQFEQSQESLNQSIELLTEWEDTNGVNEISRRELSNSVSYLSKIHIAHGRHELAKRQFEQLVGWARERLDNDPDHRIALDQLSSSLVSLGSIICNYQPASDWADGIKHFHEAANLSRQRYQDDPTNLRAAIQLAESLNNIAIVCRKLNQPAEAIDAIQESVSVMEELSRRQPDVVSTHVGLADRYSTLSTIYMWQRSYPAGEAAVRRAIEVRRSPPLERLEQPGMRHRLANDLSTLASFRNIAKDTDDAKQVLDEAIEIAIELQEEFPEVPGYSITAGKILLARGQSDRIAGRYDDAMPFFERCLKVLSDLHDRHPEEQLHRLPLATVHNELSRIHERNGEFKLADPHWQRSIDFSDSSNMPRFQFRWANALLDRGEPHGAADRGRLLTDLSIQRRDEPMFVDSIALLAQSVSLLDSDAKEWNNADLERRSEYLSWASELVEKALDQGLLQGTRSAIRLKEEPRFAPLMETPGFARIP